MQIHKKYGLTRFINARGTFTPLGVSRSSDKIARASAEALSEFFVIEELQTVVSEAIARLTDAEAGTVTHCTAAGITLSVAAVMAGSTPDKVAALPDTTGMANRVVLPAGHAIDYGQSLLQALRLAGATPVLAGTDEACSTGDLEKELAHEDTAGLLLVSSRLVHGERVDFIEAVAAAHRRGVPAIIDGAAQDMRINELLAAGADIVLTSAHKYLAAPTAGLIIGRKEMIRAVRAHENGIGRAMKATKEGIIGVLTALEEREQLDLNSWRNEQDEKVTGFVAQANELPGIKARLVPDPSGMPFSRACLTLNPLQSGMDARELAHVLRTGVPQIWVMEHKVDANQLYLELVPLTDSELQVILARLATVLSRKGKQKV
jgi:L-seryl-tRNA(Ser) seleniumtransferase